MAINRIDNGKDTMIYRGSKYNRVADADSESFLSASAKMPKYGGHKTLITYSKPDDMYSLWVSAKKIAPAKSKNVKVSGYTVKGYTRKAPKKR